MVLIFGLFFNTCRQNLFFSFLSTLAAPSLPGNLTGTQWYPVFLPNRGDHDMAPGRAYLRWYTQGQLQLRHCMCLTVYVWSPVTHLPQLDFDQPRNSWQVICEDLHTCRTCIHYTRGIACDRSNMGCIPFPIPCPLPLRERFPRYLMMVTDLLDSQSPDTRQQSQGSPAPSMEGSADLSAPHIQSSFLPRIH